MLKKITIIIGAVVFFFAALIAAVFLLQPDQRAETTPPVAKKPDPVVWDGKSERTYATEITIRKSTDKLIIEDAIFADLQTQKARIRVNFLYLGPRVFDVEKNIYAVYGGTENQAKKKVSLLTTENDETPFSVRFADVPIYALEKKSEIPLWLVIDSVQKDPLYIQIAATPDPGYTLGGELGTEESKAKMEDIGKEEKKEKKKKAKKKKNRG